MLRRLLRKLGWTRRAVQGGLCHSPELSDEEFSTVQFAWLNPDSGEDLVFVAEDFVITRCGNRTTMQFLVKGDGLFVRAVLDAVDEAVTLDISSFFVPEQLQRKGLATATLLAALDTFDMARFGTIRRSRDVHLQGYFVNKGALFARSLSDGPVSTKHVRAPVNMTRMDAARGTLRMIVAPQRR